MLSGEELPMTVGSIGAAKRLAVNPARLQVEALDAMKQALQQKLRTTT